MSLIYWENVMEQARGCWKQRTYPSCDAERNPKSGITAKPLTVSTLQNKRSFIILALHKIRYLTAASHIDKEIHLHAQQKFVDLLFPSRV